MDNRYRAAPITLPRNAPIAQTEVHLALGDGPVVSRFTLEPAGDLVFRIIDRQAVEEARIDHAAIAVISRVRDCECLWILARRADDRRHRKRIFAGEFQVAL